MALAPAKSPRILIVRRDNIGDLVCTTPLVDALRARFPDAWLGALVNTYNAGVLARNRALDAVYAYEKLKHRTGSWLGSVFGTLRQVSLIRAEKLDYVLAPSASAQALKMAMRLGAKQVLSNEGIWEVDPRHEVLRAFGVAAPLGLSGTPGPMRIYPDPARVEALRRKYALGPGVTAIHISARQAIRRWPIERYAELARHEARTHKVMFLWAPGRRDDPRHPGDDELAHALPPLENVVKVETPDLETLAAALSLAERVLCPDGGAMHIAAALGKPVVALWGDSPVERWRPWQVPHRVVQPPSKNLADLPLGPVLEALAALAPVR